MRRPGPIVISVAAAITIAGVAVTAGREEASPTSKLAASEFVVIDAVDRIEFPDFSGTTMDGQPWSSATLRGVVSVVNFWASWCGPCEDEWPELRSAAAAHGDLRWVGIDTLDRADDAKAFLTKNGTDYPHVFDADAILMKSLKRIPNETLPVTVIVDAKGRIAAWKSGPLTRSQFERGLAQFLG